MPENLTESGNFDATVSVPLDGVDRRTALSLRPAFQALANRTRWLKGALDALAGRVGALEEQNLNTRLGNLEEQNLNTRLGGLEAAYDPLRFFHVVFSNYQNLDAIGAGLAAKLVELPLSIGGGKAAQLRRLTYYTPPNTLLHVLAYKKDASGYVYVPALSVEDLPPGAAYGIVEMRENQILTNGDGDYKITFEVTNNDSISLSPRSITLHALIEVF